MKVNHRISLSVDKSIAKDFLRAGVVLGLGFSSFNIDEEDERWSKVSTLVKLYKAVDVVSSSFDKKELDDACYLEMIPVWHHGYPEPSDDFGYRNKTYDLSVCCQSCNVGFIQKQPFRMKKKPVWGNKSILQLNWVFGEYFVLPEIWSAVFKSFGINTVEVLKDGTSDTLENVIQLDIRSRANLKMGEEDKYEVCIECGAKKYHPHTRGFFPAMSTIIDVPIFKSEQWFGSGGSAWQAVIVSAALYRAIAESGLKGVSFKPLKSDSANGVVLPSASMPSYAVL